MIVYHGTSAKLARKILRSGLKPDSWVSAEKRIARAYANRNKRGRVLWFEIPDRDGRTDIIHLPNGLKLRT